MGVRAALLGVVATLAVAATAHAQAPWRDPPAAAQTRYKQPNNLFWLFPPDGWTVEERERNLWVIGAGSEPAETQCRLHLQEMVQTLWQPQRQLNEMVSAGGFIQPRQDSLRSSMASARIDSVTMREVGSVRFVRLQASGIAIVGRSRQPQPIVVMVAFALAPGQTWRLSCGTPQADAERMLPEFDEMLTSFWIINPNGGTNAR